MLKFEIIGHLGADAVVREQNGQNFVTFRVAHSEQFTRANGTRVDNTSWVSCILNGDGGNLLPYLKQGAQVYVSGDGNFRLYSSEKARGFVATGDIRVRHIELIGGKMDDVPSRLYTSDGEQVNVYKAYYVVDDQHKDKVLLARNNRQFHVNEGLWVSPLNTPQSESEGDATESDTTAEVF